MTSPRHFNAEIWDQAAFFMSGVTYSYFGEFTRTVQIPQRRPKTAKDEIFL